jgi:membrane protease YdiL (CAAX protease family)
MRKGLLVGSPPFTQTIMLIFTMITCFLLLMFVGMMLAPLVLDVSITDLMSMMNSGEMSQSLPLMRYMQILYGVSLFIIPAFFAAYLFSGNTVGYLQLKQTASVKWFGAVLLMMITAIPLINLLASLNEAIVLPESLSALEQKLRTYEDAARQATELFLNVDRTGDMFFNIFMMAVLPALGEELIFRGLLQKILIRWSGSAHTGVIIVGFLFSLMHMQFYGFFPRWLLGIVFGYLLVWSGTLWLPIFAHFVNNCITVVVSQLVCREIVPKEVELLGAAWNHLAITIITTAVCAGLLWWMRCRRVKSEEFK